MRGWARPSRSLARGEAVTLTLVASAGRALSRDSLSSPRPVFVLSKQPLSTSASARSALPRRIALRHRTDIQHLTAAPAQTIPRRMTATRNTQPTTCNLRPSNSHANMSTPRGGRGGERGRGSRGNTYTRGTAGRSRSNGAPTDNNTERPTQQVYARGGSRGATRGAAARGNTTATTSAAPRGRGNHS
jgi:hypothetical protein